MTVSIGRCNTLKALEEIEAGVILDGENEGRILLPNRYVPENIKTGDEIEVFISYDSEDRIIATTEKPYGMAGEFVMLDVVSTTSSGAFLDWGLPKDLFLPFREQPRDRVSIGDKVIVHIYADTASGRLVASTKLSRFLTDTAPITANEGDKVSVLIEAKTELGYNAIVDNRYWALIFEDQVYQSLKPGQRLSAYVRQIKPDRKANLSLVPLGYAKVDNLSSKILDMLKNSDDGTLPFNDKSSPDAIRDNFGMSKKVFKQSIGTLYKQRLILIEKDGIKLT